MQQRSGISSFLFPSRGFIPNVCKEQIKDLIKDIKEPQIRLQQSDIYIDPTDKKSADVINDILTNFECLICKSIPIEPHECSNCEVIFCLKCIEDHKSHTFGRNSRKCPQCKQDFKAKKLNQNVTIMTIEKLRFKHKCIDNENDNTIMPQSQLSAFEMFKKTPKYLEIMKNLGKIPDIKNEIENKNIQNNENQIAAQEDQQSQQVQLVVQIINTDSIQNERNQNSPLQTEQIANILSSDSAQKTQKKRLKKYEQKEFQKQSQKLHTKLFEDSNNQKAKELELKIRQEEEKLKQEELRREKLMSYDEILKHIKSGNCPQQQQFQCPMKCYSNNQELQDSFQKNNQNQQKMSYQQLIEHLNNECPLIQIKCETCSFKEQRQKFKRHKAKTCLKYLIEKQVLIRKEEKTLTEKRNTLLKQLKTDFQIQNQDVSNGYLGNIQQSLGFFMNNQSSYDEPGFLEIPIEFGTFDLDNSFTSNRDQAQSNNYGSRIRSRQNNQNEFNPFTTLQTQLIQRSSNSRRGWAEESSNDLIAQIERNLGQQPQIEGQDYQDNFSFIRPQPISQEARDNDNQRNQQRNNFENLSRENQNEIGQGSQFAFGIGQQQEEPQRLLQRQRAQLNLFDPHPAQRDQEGNLQQERFGRYSRAQRAVNNLIQRYNNEI